MSMAKIGLISRAFLNKNHTDKKQTLDILEII